MVFLRYCSASITHVPRPKTALIRMEDKRLMLVLDVIPRTANNTLKQQRIFVAFSYMHLKYFEPGIVVCAFNPNTQEAKGSLVYIASSRPWNKQK